MKVTRIQNYEDTPTLQETPIPDIDHDQVLVRVQAAAINPLDQYVVAGAVAEYFPVSFPYTVASNFAGVVEHVGPSVTKWKVGDAVIAWNTPAAGGGLAEFAAVPAASWVALPTALQAFEGAGIPTAASTAWYALFSMAQLKAGETVLIHGAAGGVGTFAVQFAHKIGAHVVATTSGGAGSPVGCRAGDRLHGRRFCHDRLERGRRA